MVKNAQRILNVTADGKVGPITLAAAERHKNSIEDWSTLSNGERVLAAAQVILNDQGYAAGVVDGIWGPNTRSAFEDWADDNVKAPVKGLRRIVMHWTAGSHNASSIDKEHYHFVIEGNGAVVKCDHAPEDNIRPVRGRYAAHTLNLNSGSIGVSLCAMRGARERPLDTGDSPVTETQVDALVRLVAELCARYGIPVTRQTVLSHAEVQPTLGVTQRGKWDFTWLPGIGQKDAVEIGDVLRARIKERL